MCPSDFFGVYYEINPWMSLAIAPNRQLASQQWQELFGLYQRLGVRVELLNPIKGLPDMVFTANAGLVYGQQAVVSRFRPAQRQGEEPHFRRWFSEQGYVVHSLPPGCHFEGAGDAKFCAGQLIGGYPIRSDRAAYDHLETLLGVPTVPVELVDPRFYHLDTCFAVLRADLVMYYPPAFSPEAQQVLAALPVEQLTIGAEDAIDFACNNVVFGDDLVLNRATPALRQMLAARGFRVHQVPMTEFLKAGGSVGCLTLIF